MSQLRQNLKEVDQVTRAPIDSLTPNERKQRSMYMGKYFQRKIKFWKTDEKFQQFLNFTWRPI